ncbi:MAG: FxDxF family PEP-CTERM protein [Sphingomicrobium sp.]
MASLAQPANAVVIVPGAGAPAVFAVSGNPFTGTSPVTATIGNTPNVGGTVATPVNFSDDFQFTIGPPGGGLIGTGSGSLATSTSVLLSATDLDLTSILVNGTPITITRTGGTATNGLIETAGTANVPIFSGQLNHIVVNGVSRGFGSYGGNLTFLPVPEPATWMMMLLGFGAIGLSIRKRKSVIAQLA